MRGGRSIVATAGALMALLLFAAAVSFGVQRARPSGPGSLAAWAAAAVRPPGMLAAGRADDLIQRHGCRLCHVIDGTGGSVGPDLAGVGQRKNRAELIAWLEDPQRIKPGTIMPRYALSPPERHLLADHLLSR